MPGIKPWSLSTSRRGYPKTPCNTVREQIYVH